MKKGKIRTVTVNERGQIVIPEDMRRDIGIESSDTLVLIEKNGEIVIKKESEIMSAVEEDAFWRSISRESLKRMWGKEDEIWDKFAREDMNG